MMEKYLKCSACGSDQKVHLFNIFFASWGELGLVFIFWR